MYFNLYKMHSSTDTPSPKTIHTDSNKPLKINVVTRIIYKNSKWKLPPHPLPDPPLARPLAYQAKIDLPAKHECVTS